jgi:2-dehydro-3-deoxy-D-arabinonate dehydratase
MADRVFLLKQGGRWYLQREGRADATPLGDEAAGRLLTSLPADEILAFAEQIPGAAEAPQGQVDAPVSGQEIWAAGVTYKRSEEARVREAADGGDVYSRVYRAERPELFYKAAAADVIGDAGEVGIRADATWSVPEPELAVVLNARLEVVGFTIGNDMSSRDIEGANPLYLPQAKLYDRSCALGPRIWLGPSPAAWPDLTIAITIRRGGETVFAGDTTTAQIHRTLDDLRAYLGRSKSFARGAILLSGTGVVPPDEFTLRAGDEVRIRIDPIGELVNSVVVVG